MSNPWTKKNPLMSMWLSAAHQAMGPARAQSTAVARRQIGAVQAEAARQIVDFWSGKPLRASVARRKPRR